MNLMVLIGIYNVEKGNERVDVFHKSIAECFAVLLLSFSLKDFLFSGGAGGISLVIFVM